MTVSHYKAALLYAKAYRKLRLHVASLLAPFQLSMLEWTLLTILAEEGTQFNFKMLAALLSVEPPLVTKLIQQLKEKSLVTETQSITDKRFRNLRLTDTGKDVNTRLTSHLNLELTKYFQDISIPDINAHLRVLQFIANK